MKNELKEVISGWLYWKRLQLEYRVTYKTIVLVLVGDNKTLDEECIFYLDEIIERKYARKILIIYNENVYSQGQGYDLENTRGLDCTVVYLEQDRIALLYRYYCFVKFFDNIVFTYTDIPSDNMLGRYIEETDINEEDAACLALYHLRHIPKPRR